MCFLTRLFSMKFLFLFRGSQSEVILAYSDSVHSFHRTFGIVTGLGILLRGDQTFPLTPLCQTQKLCFHFSRCLLLSQMSHQAAVFGSLTESSVWRLTSLVWTLSSLRSVSGALSQRPAEDPGGDGSGEERAHLSSSHLLL